MSSISLLLGLSEIAYSTGFEYALDMAAGMKQRICTCALYHSPFTEYICNTNTKINEKYTILIPFDVTNKILGPYMFGPNARETLGDKIFMTILSSRSLSR